MLVLSDRSQCDIPEFMRGSWSDMLSSDFSWANVMVLVRSENIFVAATPNSQFRYRNAITNHHNTTPDTTISKLITNPDLAKSRLSGWRPRVPPHFPAPPPGRLLRKLLTKSTAYQDPKQSGLTSVFEPSICLEWCTVLTV